MDTDMATIKKKTAKKRASKDSTAKEEDALEGDTNEIDELLSNDEEEAYSKSAEEVSSSLMGGKVVVAGRELKRVTLASLAVLQRIKSPLIMGVPLKEIEDEMLTEALVFIYIHSVDIKKLASMVASSPNPRQLILARAIEFADDIEPNEIQGIVQRILELITRATATKVQPIPSDDEAMDDPDDEGEE